ncbi:MAG: hypothetical protein QOE97_125 [Pseudonocardiales bacterium]|nr:hypothetical protein [Pseudonocardiales bacterium]
MPLVASGAAPELERLRAECVEAVRRVDAAGRQLVLLGAGPTSLVHSPLARGTFAGFGVRGEVHLGAPTRGGALELPLSLTVGAWLVGVALGARSDTRAFSVGPDFAGARAATELLRLAETEDIALLVMGDGTARRSERAPGHLDERAVPFDDAVAAALRSGDATALENLQPGLGAELLAAGVPAWRAAGRLLKGTSHSAHLNYYDDPFGVAYFVATWLRDG